MAEPGKSVNYRARVREGHKGPWTTEIPESQMCYPAV